MEQIKRLRSRGVAAHSVACSLGLTKEYVDDYYDYLRRQELPNSDTISDVVVDKSS
jgi:hypothetical protein